MKINIHISTPAAGKAQVFFTAPGSDLSKLGLNAAEVTYVQARIDKKASVVAIHQHPQLRWVVQLSDKKSGTAALEAARALVVDGQKVHVQLQPADASVVVDNTSDGEWTVSLAGEPLGKVVAGRTRSFSVAAGQVFVSVEDGKGQHSSWSGKIAPGQSLPLPPPNPVMAQLFVHNVTANAIDVRVDERGEWQSLAPDARWQAVDVQPGEHLVEMRTGDVLIRRRVTLRLDAPAYVVEPVLAR